MKATDTPLLSARHLGVRFGGVVAVNDVSFDVRRGEVFTLIGPNGAGKTTVFNLISRIYTPTSGEIEYDVIPLGSKAPHEIAALGIARTFQIIELFENATVLQNLLIGRHTHRGTGLWADLLFTPKARAAEVAAREAVERVIDLLDLQHHRESLVAGLPYGVRKVVELARALCTEPKLLLLDEVLAGLNPSEIRDMVPVIRAIAGRGITIVMIEHVMQAVMSLAGHVFVLSEGRIIAEGSPQAIAADPRVVEAYLGKGAAARMTAAGGAHA